MKIVFMGTPDFAASSLRAVLNWEKAEVVAVYCQPDRPAGRGQKLLTGPVKKLALEHNIPVLQPENFKDPAELERLKAFGADIFVVAAYGLILPQALLDIPPMGAINVHSSLLPQYRGAAPIQRAVMNGDCRSGVTIMYIEYKLDSGPIILQRALAIGIDQTAGELHDELAELGGNLVVEAMERILSGRASKIAQDDTRTSYAAKLSKADGVLDFSKTSRQVHNQARGVTPWPGAQLVILRKDASGAELEPLKVLVERGCVLKESAQAPEQELEQQKLAEQEQMLEQTTEPGLIFPLLQNAALAIACAGSGIYGITRLRPSGGKSMDATAFANGYLKSISSCHAAKI